MEYNVSVLTTLQHIYKFKISQNNVKPVIHWPREGHDTRDSNAVKMWYTCDLGAVETWRSECDTGMTYVYVKG